MSKNIEHIFSILKTEEVERTAVENGSMGEPSQMARIKSLTRRRFRRVVILNSKIMMISIRKTILTKLGSLNRFSFYIQIVCIRNLCFFFLHIE